VSSGQSAVIGAAIAREIERQKAMLDGTHDLSTVRITVRLNPKTGTPLKVQTQLETERDERHN
jgi:hypothetical protein